MKPLLALIPIVAGTALAQQPAPPSPLDVVPPPLIGALMDLYANYQQNRPHLPMTQDEAAFKAQRTLERTAKVASGVAIGTAIGALVAKPGDRPKAAAIGAVAGGVAAWIVDHYQAKHDQQVVAPPPDPGGAEPQLKSRS